MLMDWLHVNRGSGLETARLLSALHRAAFCYLSSNVSRTWHGEWYANSAHEKTMINQAFV